MLSDDHFKALEALAQSYGGKMTHRYDQGSDEHSRAGGVLENGWCFGVAVNWIGHKKQKKERFWDWLATVQGQTACTKVMVNQKLLGLLIQTSTEKEKTKRKVGSLVTASHGHREELEYEKVVLVQKELKNRYGMESDRTHSVTGYTSVVGQLASSLNLAIDLNGVVNYAVIGVSNDCGGHAMAFAGKSLTFMDPNAGEFEFSEISQAVDWLEGYFKTMAEYGFGTYDKIELYSFSCFE